MTKRGLSFAVLAAIGMLGLAKPHILHTTVCRMGYNDSCPMIWCSYRGAGGTRIVDFDERTAPSFCWPVRFFPFDRPQP